MRKTRKPVRRLTESRLRRIIRQEMQFLREARESKASKYLRDKLPTSWLTHLPTFEPRAREIDRVGGGAREHSLNSLWSYISHVQQKEGSLPSQRDPNDTPAVRYLRDKLPASWQLYLDDFRDQGPGTATPQMTTPSEHSANVLWSYIEYVKDIEG